MPDISFKMETTRTIRQIVATRQFTSAAGLDITSAFQHFGIRVEDRNMLLIIGPDGRIYRPRAAFFGLKPLPRLWTKAMRVALRILRENGIVVTIYIDDGFNLAESPLQAFLDLIFSVQLLQYLGYTMSWKKITLPTPRPLFLGFIWDLTAGTISVSAEKLRRIRKLIRAVMKSAVAPMRLVAKLLGTLQSAKEAVEFVTLESRELQREYNNVVRTSTVNPFDKVLPITHTVRRALNTLLYSIHRWNGKCFLPPVVDAVVKTDASETGLGGNITTTVSQGTALSRTAAHWTPKLLHGYLNGIYRYEDLRTWCADTRPLTQFIHIQTLEAIATHQAMKVFYRESSLRDKTVLVMTDNIASAYYMAREGGTRNTPLSKVTEKIVRWTRKKGIRLFVEHIPGVLNTLAVSSEFFRDDRFPSRVY